MRSFFDNSGADRAAAYRYASRSGLLTVVAAGTATAGHLWSCRWSHATKKAVVTNFKATWQQVVGFTGGQEVGMSLSIMRTYTAAHSGGTAAVLTAPAFKLRDSYPATSMADIRIATTGELTPGTHTIDAIPILSGGQSELSAGTATARLAWALQYPTTVAAHHGIVLTQDMGLLLTNHILMGAAGTARLHVEMEWIEE